MIVIPFFHICDTRPEWVKIYSKGENKMNINTSGVIYISFTEVIKFRYESTYKKNISEGLIVIARKWIVTNFSR